MHRSRIGLAAAILALVATVAYLGVTLNTASAQLEETSAEFWIEHDHAHHESLRKYPEYYE